MPLVDTCSNSFSVFDHPGQINHTNPDESALGINDAGQIVGSYTLPTTGLPHGFLKDGATTTLFDYPGAQYTIATGINNAGQIVGVRGPDGHGFLKDGTSFTSLDYPGASATFFFDINNTGQIAGKYRITVPVGGGEQYFDHGLVFSGGGFTAFDIPGAYGTEAKAINDTGTVVGTWVQTNGVSHGFSGTGGTFTSFDFPGATSTYVYGVNNQDQIVGYFTDGANKSHAFLKDGESFTAFDFPSPTGTNFTWFTGINDEGRIVGIYDPVIIRATPEPSSLLLIVTGVFGLGLFSRNKRIRR